MPMSDAPLTEYQKQLITDGYWVVNAVLKKLHLQRNDELRSYAGWKLASLPAITDRP